MQISIDTSVSNSIVCSSVEKSIQSIEFYEAAILADETIVSNYWYLGVSYLLAGKEEEAQAAWLAPISIGSEAEVDIYTEDLLTILDREANNRVEILDTETAWLLRQHFWTISPERVDNILKLISIASSLNRLTTEQLLEWRIADLLEKVSFGNVSDDLLEETLKSLIKSKLFNDLSLQIINNCLKIVDNKLIISKVVGSAFALFFQENAGLFSVKVVEICQSLIPTDLDLIQVLSGLYTGVELHAKAIDYAEHYYQLSNSKFQKLVSSYLIHRAYLTSGNWENYLSRLEKHRELVKDFILNTDGISQEQQKSHLIITSFFSLYTSDNPQIDRPLQNQIAAIYQNNLAPLSIGAEFEKLSLPKRSGVIRIGYLASTLKRHSVGWLSRWIFQYHDRQSFQIFNYCINQNSQDDFNHKWFREKTDVTYHFNNHPQEIVNQIKTDEIDILIDLDSLTFDISCQVMAYKPAPVQATWLGLDASGIPAIDYFIVDPYVVAEDAQDYYQEKLWKLPQTYLAVEGFEVGISNITRQELNIPADAIVYFSSQGGYKRHPDNIRCQMRIIANVPGSYLLIKGKSDPDMIRDLFGKIGEEEGVSLDRLRFLPGVRDEYTHRANLAIADIVLDTFPYNGATTTLETLWMGIPMVTRVGKQFAARNSYTFMLNAGIEEGIAWTEEEYVEWGIKLGLDRNLRLEVREKLRSSRQTAPVWNTKQFTLDMEQAYREMWAIYQQNNCQIGNLHENN